MSTVNELDESLLLGSSFSNLEEGQSVTVKAEDLTDGEGFDYSRYFFEPQPDCNYLIKFLPNIHNPRELIGHRSVYNRLPDPDRRGKTFRYVSSGSAKTCPVLQAFFDLNEVKKSGGPNAAVAGKKIEEYLSRRQEGCAVVQVIKSPNKEEIGIVRLMRFSTFGPNAHIANLINQKLNPTKEAIENGVEREDIFNIFGSKLLNIVCTKSTYDGREGRDYSQSQWLDANKGAMVTVDGVTTQFTPADIELIKSGDENATKRFKAFKEILMHPDYNMHLQFSFKTPDDPSLDEDTANYVKQTAAKVEKIIPVLLNGSLNDIKMMGTEDAKADGSSDANKQSNILAESIPDELKDVVGGSEAPVANTTAATQSAENSIDDILGDI